MSDVEENNFEGRVSTKPREPSSAAARCSGARGESAVGRARCAGARGSRLEGSPWLPRRPASPPRSLLRAADRSPAWSYRLLSLPFLSASHLCSEVRVPGAVGQQAAGRSLRPESGRCFPRWRPLGPPHRRRRRPPPRAVAAGARGRKCARGAAVRAGRRRWRGDDSWGLCLLGSPLQ